MSNQSPISKAQEVPANAATVAMPKTPCGKGKWFQEARGNLMNPVLLGSSYSYNMFEAEASPAN